MKSIMLSIQPKWVAKILNGEKTIEVRKRFPKDFRGWVYIYCKKDNKKDWYYDKKCFGCYSKDNTDIHTVLEVSMHFPILNGKVIGRFYCNTTEEIRYERPGNDPFYRITDTLAPITLLTRSCITANDLFELKPKYAVHISGLEVFDKLKELWEFEKYGSFTRSDIKCKNKDRGICNYGMSLDGLTYVGCMKARLTKAPSTYCYIMEEERDVN